MDGVQEHSTMYPWHSFILIQTEFTTWPGFLWSFAFSRSTELHRDGKYKALEIHVLISLSRVQLLPLTALPTQWVQQES